MSSQRLLFVHAVRTDGVCIAAACRQFQISRPTGYEILRRYDESGCDGLEDLSRAPQGNSRAVDQFLCGLIVAEKARHPSWGPKKIRARLVVRHPDSAWSAVSTFGRILEAAGLVDKSRRRSKPPRLGQLSAAAGANDVWCADFKGQFPLVGGQPCFPLTVTDNDSRFLLRCHALPSTAGGPMSAVVLGAFIEFGLPLVMRTDNGSPFASSSATGLTAFAVTLIRLGIVPERIDPGSPQQNGRHERMHRTLKAEATTPKPTMKAQQTVFDAWKGEYNEERPHESLGQKTPASVYSPSVRAMPAALPQLEYEESMATRKVRCNGCVKWHGGDVYVGMNLEGHTVGIEGVDERHDALYVGFLPVAIVDLAKSRLIGGKSAEPLLRSVREKSATMEQYRRLAPAHAKTGG